MSSKNKEFDLVFINELCDDIIEFNKLPSKLQDNEGFMTDIITSNLSTEELLIDLNVTLLKWSQILYQTIIKEEFELATKIKLVMKIEMKLMEKAILSIDKEIDKKDLKAKINETYIELMDSINFLLDK